MSIDLTEAITLHRQGQLEEAAHRYQAALIREPENPAALHLLGVVHLQQNQPTVALDLIRRAIAAQPTQALFHANLAETYWALGKSDLAIAACRHAIQLEPTSAIYHCNLGSLLRSRGDLESAIKFFDTAVQLDPHLFPAHNNLGNALRQRGQLSKALEHLRRAVELDPSSPEARGNLGIILLEQNLPAEALQHSAEAVRLRPLSPVYRNNLGNVLHTLGRLDEAVTSFRAAIEIDPNLAVAYAALGGSLENLGEFDASIAAMRQALRLDPNHADALARLSTRLRAKLEPNERAAIDRMLASPDLPDIKRWTLLFGLAQVLDAQNQFEAAARASIQANSLQRADFVRRGKGYDHLNHHRFVTQLIDTFNPGFFARVRHFGVHSTRPIFVLGMPRSGTTLVEQILASHPRVFGAGELGLLRQTFLSIPEATGQSLTSTQSVSYLEQPSVRHLADRHLEQLARIDDTKDRIVDKMPENYLYLGLIAAIFPCATVIHCRRDPRDIALSCWSTHFDRVRWACDTTDIRSRIAEYLRQMDHWRAVLPIPIHEVDYETMVTDTEANARRLIACCGLDWHPGCLDFHRTQRAVQTASVVQVRQPIYSTSIGRWKNYAAFLPELLAPIS